MVRGKQCDMKPTRCIGSRERPKRLGIHRTYTTLRRRRYQLNLGRPYITPWWNQNSVSAFSCFLCYGTSFLHLPAMECKAFQQDCRMASGGVVLHEQASSSFFNHRAILKIIFPFLTPHAGHCSAALPLLLRRVFNGRPWMRGQGGGSEGCG